jgi:hypothetical protein
MKLGLGLGLPRRSSDGVPANAILDEAGAPLLDEAGAYLLEE